MADGAVRRAAVALALLALLGLLGCGGDGERPVALDGSPRVPDDEGIATELTHDSITLDGERTYEVSDELLAFSTYTATLEPMLNRRGQYVQIGLDGDTMVWMAGIAAVVDVQGEKRVFYNGVIETVEGGRAVFVDGTVFAVADGVEAPPSGSLVQVTIDPGRRQAVDLHTRS